LRLTNLATGRRCDYEHRLAAFSDPVPGQAA
jgi:hypothetical protein